MNYFTNICSKKKIILSTKLHKQKNKCYIRGTESVRTSERDSGEILINNLKTENKCKFQLMGLNFDKHQNKLINENVERKNKTQEEKKEKKMHAQGRKKNRLFFSLLSVGNKWEILKLIMQYNKLFDET